MLLRVATYNILHGADFPHKRATGEDIVDLTLAERTLRAISPDICGLNEVRNQERVAGLCNQARELAERLGYHYVFARAIDHRGGEYGNALLSRFSISSSTLHPIVVPESERVCGGRYENRVVLKAQLDVAGRELAVIVTHFGLRRDEIDLAARTVVSLARGCSAPLIVMGDFNVTPDDAAISLLKTALSDTAEGIDGDFYTFPSYSPEKKIDYIMTAGGVVTRSLAVVDSLTSDHKPLFAEIEIGSLQTRAIG